MLADNSSLPSDAPQCPCGPDCRYARTLTGSYGEWHWCAHPVVGGRIMRDGRECRHFATQISPRSQPSFLHWQR